jgi:outer membrane protein TolC
MPSYARKVLDLKTQALSCFLLLTFLTAPPLVLSASDETVTLEDLVAEGLTNSPEILAAKSRADAAGYRIPQAKSLPDPMATLGYQNDGFSSFTLGRSIMSMGMSGLSQQFPFWGKRALKGEVAARDSESFAALSDAARHRVVAQIKLYFYDLFLAYKTLDILSDRKTLFSKIEDAARSRYASATGMQQEVIMAQTEKYMILEKEEMQRQRIEALQGMLNTTVGREVSAPLGRPVLPPAAPFLASLEEVVSMAKEHSPDVRSRQKMVEGAEAKVKLARKEYYPDVTVGGNYFYRSGYLGDMWSMTFSFSLPIFYKTKQEQAVAEAQAGFLEAKRELAATELMLASNVKEGYSMVQAADRLMKLYSEGLIPKANQDVQLAFSNYVTGRVDALTAITRIKNLLDYDLLYWSQLVEREKAIARLHAVTGIADTGQTGRQTSRGGTKKAALGEAQ